MLDVALIREQPEAVRRALDKRGAHPDIPAFLALDERHRAAQRGAEELRAERKRLARALGQGLGNVEALELRAQAATVGDRLAALEASLTDLAAQRREFLDALPNLPDPEVPAGGKDCNEVLRLVGEPARFAFPPADHVRLARALGLVDYERGVKLAGAGHWIYRGDGALLEWALLNYFIAGHVRDGYEFVLPPHVLTYEAGYVAGQFPKFAGEVFTLGADTGAARRFLLPTAETALVNLHRGETLPEGALPLKYAAYTPCYRGEAGGYRAAERGTLRGHQFNKVELVQYTRPGDSDAAHAQLLATAEALVAGLGLHYRVSRLAAADTSAAMAKTYDIEVYLPSLDAYVEVSSVSNARDYQARRGAVRYKPAAGGKNAFVHTLNASGLATSRLLPALLEQHQHEDGTVTVPETLRPWITRDRLTPPPAR